MRKIGNLLCKLAIYCVNFGENLILQKFCLCKKNDKYEVCLSQWAWPYFFLQTAYFITANLQPFLFANIFNVMQK